MRTWMRMLSVLFLCIFAVTACQTGGSSMEKAAFVAELLNNKDYSGWWRSREGGLTGVTTISFSRNKGSELTVTQSESQGTNIKIGSESEGTNIKIGFLDVSSGNGRCLKAAIQRSM